MSKGGHMKVMVLIGLARSGKDTTADYLRKKYGFRKFVMSEAIIDEMKKKGIKGDKMGISEFGDRLRKKHGMAVVARLVLKKIEKSRARKVAIVGPRSVEEIEFFRKMLPETIVLRVESKKGKRFGRRDRKDPETKAGFFERDRRDIWRKGLKKALRMADAEIRNDSSMSVLHKKVDLVAKRLAI